TDWAVSTSGRGATQEMLRSVRALRREDRACLFALRREGVAPPVLRGRATVPETSTVYVVASSERESNTKVERPRPAQPAFVAPNLRAKLSLTCPFARKPTPGL